jgi:type VI secretion system secreted protein Hcp
MAVDMFLKVGDLEGESVDNKYAKWIDVLSWSWGMSQSGSAHVAGGAGAGKVNVQDLMFTHYLDSCSPNLMLKCCNGKHYPEAKVICRKAGEKPLEYLKVTMTDVLVSSVQPGGQSGGDRVIESVSLNFAKVKVEYTPQKKDGSGDAVKEMTWNIATNVAE